MQIVHEIVNLCVSRIEQTLFAIFVVAMKFGVALILHFVNIPITNILSQ